MTDIEKKDKIKQIMRNKSEDVKDYYDFWEGIGDYKSNYMDFMTTGPVNVEAELERLRKADYDLCAALLTMLLREDYFSNGAFIRRFHRGQVTKVLKRMFELL